MKKLTVGLIGNPNSGKTTLFNQLTGARQRVGNWAGVTVERKEGVFATTDHQVTLVDLPGTYSLTTISSQTSLDEQIACHYILSGEADMLINVVDASNLERNLYLTLQLLELGIPCVVALNMLDIAEFLNGKYGEGTVTVEIKDSYRNMLEKIKPHFHLVETARKATRMAGLEPEEIPVRGGTDGAMLSWKGLPCPNLGTGGFNFHGVCECITAERMDRCTEILLNIIKLYAE